MYVCTLRMYVYIKVDFLMVLRYKPFQFQNRCIMYYVVYKRMSLSCY